MLLSHRFGSADTLTRARFWLTQHGFEVAPEDAESHDVSRLSLNVNFSQASAALALIDSIEKSDPEGWPGMLTLPSVIHHHGEHSLLRDRRFDQPASKQEIHWHKVEETSHFDAISDKVREYMLSRWE